MEASHSVSLMTQSRTERAVPSSTKTTSSSQVVKLAKQPRVADLPEDASELLDFLCSAVGCLNQESPSVPLLPCLLVGGFPRNLMMGKPLGDVDMVIRSKYFDQFLFAVEMAAKKTSTRITWKTDHILKNKSCKSLRLVTATLTLASNKRWDLDIREIKSSLSCDALARDFTCNSIYLDPVTLKIIDTLGGVEDINKGILRPCNDLHTVFNHSSRWIRAFRFQQTLGLCLESQVKYFVQANSFMLLQPAMFGSIRAELGKVFRLEKDRWAILEEMVDFDFLDCLSEFAQWKAVRQDQFSYLNLKASVILLFKHVALAEQQIGTTGACADPAFPDFSLVEAAKIVFLLMVKLSLFKNEDEPSELMNVIKLVSETNLSEYYFKMVQLAEEYLKCTEDKDILQQFMPVHLANVLNALLEDGILKQE